MSRRFRRERVRDCSSGRVVGGGVAGSFAEADVAEGLR